MVLQQPIQGTGSMVSVGSLPSGMYHLLLRKGGHTERHTIVINR
jgi:hypothetical protein